MSKTFKALLRAAHERAGRKQQERQRKSEGKPAEIQKLESPPPQAPKPPQSADPVPVSPAGEPGEEKIAKAPRPLPQGQPDQELRDLLESELMVSANGGVLEEEGWLRGYLDRKLAQRLLERFGLLHCLMLDERNWFWFWASSTDARALAEQYGLPLDLESEPEA